MHRGDDDDRQTDQDFESDWIDGVTPLKNQTQRNVKVLAKDASDFCGIALCVLGENLCALCG